MLETTEIIRQKRERYIKLLVTTELRGFGKIKSYIAWNYCVNNSTASIDQLSFNKSCISHSGADKSIDLGISPMEQSALSKVVFLDHIFDSADKQAVYRFSHEISHKLAPTIAKLYPSFDALWDRVTEIRKSKSVGFSALSSSFYSNPEIQSKEDIVELVNMFVLNPQYLRTFLFYMFKISQNDQSDRRQLCLAKINLNTAKSIYKIINDSVGKELGIS